MVRDGAHFQVVCECQARKAKLASEEIGQNGGRQGGWEVFVQGRVQDVRGHDRGEPVLDRMKERA